MTAVQLVRPFTGRLVDPVWARRVVSPMHDTLSDDERRQLLAQEPDTFLHVTSDPRDRPDSTDGSAGSDGHNGSDGSAAETIGSPNAASLQRLLQLGAFGPPVGPPGAAYAYRMSGAQRDRTGVVVQVAVAGFADGRVMGHEGVQPARVERLVRLVDAVPLRSELVSLVHLDADLDGLVPVGTLVARAAEAEPDLAVRDVGGVEQAVWRLDQLPSEAVLGGLARQTLFIADGHHRVAAALRRWERDGRPDDASLLCVAYAADQVQLYAFHRRVRGPVDGDRLITLLRKDFRVRVVDDPTQQRGAFGLYVGGRVRRWHRVEPLRRSPASGVAGLDVTLLDDRVLTPLLAGHHVDFEPELREVALAVRSCDDDGGVLFTLAPPRLADLVDVAERGEVMSAKSTYVEPKPRIGLFLQ